jgi:hypothetical protein
VSGVETILGRVLEREERNDDGDEKGWFQGMKPPLAHWARSVWKDWAMFHR